MATASPPPATSISPSDAPRNLRTEYETAWLDWLGAKDTSEFDRKEGRQV